MCTSNTSEYPQRLCGTPIMSTFIPLGHHAMVRSMCTPTCAFPRPANLINLRDRGRQARNGSVTASVHSKAPGLRVESNKYTYMLRFINKNKH